MSKDLMDRIDETIQGRSLLEHPFYQAWTKGTLPLDSLKKYAAQYYHFEKAYPRFLSGLHHRCDDAEVRQSLLVNLWDEEYGDENHVELWLRFCDALGLDREEVKSSEPSQATRNLVQTFDTLTTKATLAAGAAALYAFESQTPAVAREKIRGLREFYGIAGGGSVSFFSVHEEMDIKHASAERETIRALAGSEADKSSAVQAAEEAAAALWRFLDGVY